MALIALASAKGSPGVTTTATALAAYWPAPCLLVEADLTGGSLIGGWYAGSLELDRSLSQVAFDKARNPQARLALDQNAIALSATTPDKAVLPGFASGAHATAMTPFWGELAHELAALQASGRDAIIDLGRLRLPRDEREALLQQVDLLLLVTTTDLPMALATIDLATHLSRQIGSSRLSPLGLLTKGPAKRMRTKTLAERAGIPHLGRIPDDPVRAEPITYGTQQPCGFDRSEYVTVLVETAKTLHTRAIEHRSNLTPTL